MQNNINLTAEKREKFGTSYNRNIRLKNKIPAVIYGEKKDNDNINLNENEIKKAFKYKYISSNIININVHGNDQKVIIKEIQRHQYKNKILHIDFQRVDDNTLISTKIPLIFTNKKNCIGVKYGGKINIKMVDIKIICKAKDLPEYINVDLSKVKLNEHIYLSDIKQGLNITFLDEKKGFNRVVVAIKIPKKSVSKGDADNLISSDNDEKQINDKEAK
jgi:large subunit ribosomal protein L25